MPDTIERRALALLRFTDAATGAPADVAVAANCPARLVRKPGGLAVLAGEGGFDVPPGAAVGSVPLALDLTPAGGRFAPRRVTLLLPRDPDPAQADSLFLPVLAGLFPGPGYVPGGLLAAVRVVVRRTTDGARVEGALVRLLIGGSVAARARALTDAAGECLLAADGVRLATAGPGATVLADVEAVLDVIVDPAQVRFNDEAALPAARDAAQARRTGLIDPDDLEARLAATAAAAVAIRLRPGAIAAASIAWPPP